MRGISVMATFLLLLVPTGLWGEEAAARVAREIGDGRFSDAAIQAVAGELEVAGIEGSGEALDAFIGDSLRDAEIALRFGTSRGALRLSLRRSLASFARTGSGAQYGRLERLKARQISSGGDSPGGAGFGIPRGSVGGNTSAKTSVDAPTGGRKGGS